jgi:hypothetical protein
MSKSALRAFQASRKWVAETMPGAIVLWDVDHALDYENAVSAYAKTGDRAALLRALFAIGITGDVARWHAANPGRRRGCVVGE